MIRARARTPRCVRRRWEAAGKERMHEAAQPDTRPFFFAGGPGAVLLLHGLGSTPFEMRELGRALAAAGYAASGPALAGHDQLANLARAGRGDWCRGSREALDRLRRKHGPVAVAGQSLGALLALRLALDRPADVAALVLLAPAFALANPWPRRLRPLLRLLVRALPPRFTCLPKNGSDIADPQARSVHPGLPGIPLHGVLELLALQDELWPELERIEQPVLLLHGRHDHTASLSASVRASRRLPRLRRMVVLEHSAHVLTVDFDRERVRAEVVRFLARELGPARKPAPPG